MVESNLIETFLYKSEDGPVSIKVIIDQENETLWATQKTMANLFNKTPKNISKHLNNIFDSGELVKDEVTVNPNDSTISGIVIKINPEANTQPILYNLDAMISVGYRVNSKEATQFRKWATKILKEYMVKGFVLDMDLLKNGTRFGNDYYEQELSTDEYIENSLAYYTSSIKQNSQLLASKTRKVSYAYYLLIIGVVFTMISVIVFGVLNL